MAKYPELILQFHPSELDALIQRYDGDTNDNAALNAGTLILAGNYTKENLKVIVNWKSHRALYLIEENQDSDIAAALQFAVQEGTSEAFTVGVMTSLRGVGIPMASAILTAIHPEKYTILDYRALESLGVGNWPDNVGFYIYYLEACRELAARHGKSLRNLDRALWQWSKEKSEG